MGMVFFKYIFPAPFAQAVDIQFGTFRTHAPCYLVRRTDGFSIFGAGGGADKFNRFAGAAGQGSGLMLSVCHVATINKVMKVHGFFIIDQGKDLGFDPQIRIGAGAGHA